MPQVISATDAKNQFSELVNRVVYNGEEFIVHKQGKPAVKISPISDQTSSKKTFDPGLKFLLKLAKLPEEFDPNVGSLVATDYKTNISKKNTPFDHYLCTLAKKNNIKYVFSFDSFYKKQGLTLAEDLL